MMGETGYLGEPEATVDWCMTWARKFLLASKGPCVNAKWFLRHCHSDAIPYGVERFYLRIPILVPAIATVTDDEVGRMDVCVFADSPNQKDLICSIHQYSPYGCRMFDTHMTAGDSDKRAHRGIYAVREAWRKAFSDEDEQDEGDELTTEEGMYVSMWLGLSREGLIREESTSESRRMVQKSIDVYT